MTVDAVIFDKDGTLFDFAATWEAWAAAFLERLSRGDPDRAERLGASVGFSYRERRFARDSIVIAGTPAEIAAALSPSLPGFDAGQLIALLNEEAARAPQREAVPLLPFLSDLKARGLRLGVATNDAEQPARAHLRAAGVEQCFDFIAGFDSGHGAKPEPGPLLAFAEAMAIAPARIVMVGDSLHDLRAGRAAGMRTVGVLTGLAGHETLSPMADVVLPDIGHLPRWLLRVAPTGVSVRT
ncbi:HAD family hydrolase [Cognatishimia sp. F0-27]|uniref:HAD family hydrolase n=1 Tax=Cognatishimia sp. F0-27 TaxID=2816855 RepID=UPI001D0C6CC9|nr:HAD family hydrolase [Cognatishimia sp. F0-27]MCC1492176.1 HAD family hydrolase [Cognatishimia sp. F0-27]